MPTLPLTQLANAYSPAATVEFAAPCQSVTLTVTVNGAAIAQFKIPLLGSPNSIPDWNGEEHTLLPGAWTFTPADFGGRLIWGVKLRNLVVGTNGIVAVSAG